MYPDCKTTLNLICEILLWKYCIFFIKRCMQLKYKIRNAVMMIQIYSRQLLQIRRYVIRPTKCCLTVIYHYVMWMWSSQISWEVSDKFWKTAKECNLWTTHIAETTYPISEGFFVNIIQTPIKLPYSFQYKASRALYKVIEGGRLFISTFIARINQKKNPHKYTSRPSWLWIYGWLFYGL